MLADIAAVHVIDIPPVVCSRHYACILTPGSGQVKVNINVNAGTQYGQYMYVTSNIGTLGNWNTNLGIPVDSSTDPVWKNAVNLAASSSFQYKYYRKNSDGSVTWQCYPGYRAGGGWGGGWPPDGRRGGPSGGGGLSSAAHIRSRGASY